MLEITDVLELVAAGLTVWYILDLLDWDDVIVSAVETGWELARGWWRERRWTADPRRLREWVLYQTDEALGRHQEASE
ncbi:MAG: hypothetical protein ACYCV4_18085 [Dermatophilaceae bacterium]